MRKRRRILWLGLLVVVLGGLAWFLLGGSEPEYQGRSLSEWLELYDYSDGPKGSGAGCGNADEAIRKIGTNALPYLVKMTEAKDSRFNRMMMGLAEKQSWIRIQHVPAWNMRVRAYCGLRALGKDARPMIPLLTRALDEGEHSIPGIAAGAQANIGLDGIGPLTNALTNDDWEVRWAIVRALGEYREAEPGEWPARPYSKEELLVSRQRVIPILLDLFNDTNYVVRAGAASALGQIRAEPARVIPALVSFLSNTNEDLRFWAVEALANFSGQATSVVPALVSALKDQDEQTRQAATNALKKIDPEAARKEGIK